MPDDTEVSPEARAILEAITERLRADTDEPASFRNVLATMRSAVHNGTPVDEVFAIVEGVFAIGEVCDMGDDEIAARLATFDSIDDL